MKGFNHILIFLLLISCSTTKKLSKNGSIPTKFVFKKSMVSSQRGISNLKLKQDSLIDVMYSPNRKDSLKNKKLEDMQITDFLSQTPETIVHIEIQNDTIWRYTKQNDKMIGDYLMIQKNSGILNYYDKSKSLNYKKYNLFARNDEYEIYEDKKDRKEIKGFDCFKLKLVKIHKESDLGNTIYEMYVTEQFELPVHSVINLTKFVPNIFPMEIKVSEEKLSVMSELYELIKIE